MAESPDDEAETSASVAGIPLPYVAIGALVLAAIVFLIGAAI
ncbi:hypothetical protein [Halosegnis longus]|nr:MULTISPECIES: hypothetical protein [Halobacteriales]